MCYSPVHIRNKSLKFDIEKDRVFFDVPCGHCGQCKKRKAEDATARIYYEYLRTVNTPVENFYYKSPNGKVEIKCHGYVYMQCFTYNEEMCPWLHGIRCFRPDDYRSFMLFLRNDLEKLGYGRSCVKVHWVSEYGGQTYRPHYHALFFITCGITPEEFEKLCRKSWCVVYHKNHELDCTHVKRIRLGWTELENPYSKNLNHTCPSDLVVDGMGALGYCAQYLGKDIDFETVLHEQKNSLYDGKFITKDDYKFLKPFTRQSNGIGDNIPDCINIEDLMDGKMTIPDNIDGQKVINLPLYIDRKVFYDYDPSDKCFRLNERGYEMKEHRLKHNRGYVKKRIDYLMSNISKLWSVDAPVYISSILRHQANKNSLRFIHYTAADCMRFVSDKLYNRMDDFCDYIILYKNITSTFYEFVDSGEDLSKVYYDFIKKSFHSPPVKTFNMEDIVNDSLDYRIITHNLYGCVCNRFKDFDEVLAILNGINLAYSEKRQQAYLKRKDEVSRHKNVLTLIPSSTHKKFSAYASYRPKISGLATASQV